MIFNDLPLARRLETAEVASAKEYVRAKQFLAPEIGAVARPIEDGLAIFTGAGSPVNRAQGLGMQRPVREESIEAAEAFFTAYGETTRVDLNPLAHDSLHQLLRARGYGVQLFKNVWWRPMGRIAPVNRATPRVQVEIVTEKTALLWAQVVGAAFSGRSSLDEADTSISLANVYKDGATCFLAWIDDDPAGGGAVAIHHGVAILFSTSVRPALRRMGVQSALLRARLAFAADAGCDLVTVSTTPGGASQHNVERFGFRLAYTKPTMVKREKEKED